METGRKKKERRSKNIGIDRSIDGSTERTIQVGISEFIDQPDNERITSLIHSFHRLSFNLPQSYVTTSINLFIVINITTIIISSNVHTRMNVNPSTHLYKRRYRKWVRKRKGVQPTAEKRKRTQTRQHNGEGRKK